MLKLHRCMESYKPPRHRYIYWRFASKPIPPDGLPLFVHESYFVIGSFFFVHVGPIRRGNPRELASHWPGFPQAELRAVAPLSLVSSGGFDGFRPKWLGHVSSESVPEVKDLSKSPEARGERNSRLAPSIIGSTSEPSRLAA